MFAVLSRAAEWRICDFSAQQLANTAWAFAMARQRDALLFAVLARDYKVELLDGPCAGEKKPLVHKNCTVVEAEAGAHAAATGADEAPPAATGAGAEVNKDAVLAAEAKKAAPNKECQTLR